MLYFLTIIKCLVHHAVYCISLSCLFSFLCNPYIPFLNYQIFHLLVSFHFFTDLNFSFTCYNYISPVPRPFAGTHTLACAQTHTHTYICSVCYHTMPIECVCGVCVVCVLGSVTRSATSAQKRGRNRFVNREEPNSLLCAASGSSVKEG